MIQVFSVKLNKKHTVVRDLDIYSVAGFSTAHDELVPFSIEDGFIKIQKSLPGSDGQETSTFNGNLQIDFVKV